MEAVRRWGPSAWALMLATVMLGPALGSGYVLSYDMVWVPDLALRPDFLGTGSGLPRAVPSDAVIAVLDEVVPGALLQKVVLLAALAGGGMGIDRWLLDRGVPARLAAVSFYVWNPFVVERLVIGHWPVLVAYATLPWVALLARRARDQDRLPGLLLVLVPLGSLSASAGLMTAAALLAFGLTRRRRFSLPALVLAANAPWLVAGLLHAGVATSDPDAAARFALQGEGWLPAPVTALSLGGIWNAEVVPATRDGALGIVALLALGALAVLGVRGWRHSTARRDQAALLGVWALGWGLAVLTWLVPDLVGWLAGNVPGGGLVRDGSRLLGLCAPSTAVLVAHGVQRVGQFFRGLTGDREQALFIATMLALLPVALMPDAGWGASGTLRAVDYPASYAATRSVVPEGGRVLLLPFSSYRAPAWNHGHKVLDPMGRFLSPDFVASDELVVSGEVLAGEDPRGDEVRAALAEPTAQRRAESLSDIGITTVVAERDAQGDAPEVAGEVLATGAFTVVALAGTDGDRPGSWWAWAMGGAWVAFAAPGILALSRLRRPRNR